MKLPKIKHFFQKNGSLILTCMGAAGVVATAISAAKCTPKAIDILYDCKKEDEDKLHTILRVAPTYIPAAGIAIGTIACIFGANALNRRQQAMLISAYGYLDQRFRQYRKEVKEIYGEEAETEINRAACKKLTENTPAKETRLFYDPYSNRYFERTMLEVIEAEMLLNRDYTLHGYCTLNNFYYFLGLDLTDEGDMEGWSADYIFDLMGYAWVDFNHTPTTMADGLECLIIQPAFDPEPLFQR